MLTAQPYTTSYITCKPVCFAKWVITHFSLGFYSAAKNLRNQTCILLAPPFLTPSAVLEMYILATGVDNYIADNRGEGWGFSMYGPGWDWAYQTPSSPAIYSFIFDVIVIRFQDWQVSTVFDWALLTEQHIERCYPPITIKPQSNIFPVCVRAFAYFCEYACVPPRQCLDCPHAGQRCPEASTQNRQRHWRTDFS